MHDRIMMKRQMHYNLNLDLLVFNDKNGNIMDL